MALSRGSRVQAASVRSLVHRLGLGVGAAAIWVRARMALVFKVSHPPWAASNAAKTEAVGQPNGGMSRTKWPQRGAETGVTMLPLPVTMADAQRVRAASAKGTSPPSVHAMSCNASGVMGVSNSWLRATSMPAASEEPPPKPPPVGMRLESVMATGSDRPKCFSHARWARTARSRSKGQSTVSCRGESWLK